MAPGERRAQDDLRYEPLFSRSQYPWCQLRCPRPGARESLAGAKAMKPGWV